MRMIAAQHVSGVLTRDQSPKGRGGFQTILHTYDMLSLDDVRTIEHRVQCFPAEEERAKWQYCRLSGERPMITRIVPIPEPDEFGRRGRYLTHSLIFDPSDWQQLDDAPFDLMRPENFFSSLDQVLGFDGFTAGKAPAVPREAHKQWNKEAGDLIRKWPEQQLKGLIWLAGNPQLITERGHYVQLIGSESEILEALKVVFYLGGPTARKFCSFDTNALGCAWRPDMSFWGRSFPSGNKASARFAIDAARRQVNCPESSVGHSSYSRWIETLARAERFSMLQENLECARALAKFLEGEEPDCSLSKEMDDEFQRTFAGANVEMIRERSACILPEQISQPLRRAAIEQVGQKPETFLRYLIEGQLGRLSCELLYQTLLNHADLPLTADDLEWLTGLGKKHIGLRLLLALPPGNESRRIGILVTMNSDQYQQCVKALQTRADFQAWQVFSPQHLGDWFTLCSKSGGIEDIRKGISCIVAHGGRKDRRQIEQIVRHLNPDQQKYLQRWLNSAPYRLRKLKAALAEALKATEDLPSPGENSSIFQRIKGIFVRRARRV